MGSTRIDAPQIDPINVAQQIKETSRAYRESTPDIIAAERELRGPMQQLALEDAQTALMGGVTPAMKRSRDAAEQQLQTAQGKRDSAVEEFRQRIKTLNDKDGKYDDASEIARLTNLKDEYTDLVAKGDENKTLYQNSLDTVRVELGEDVPNYQGSGILGTGFTAEKREERFSGQQQARDNQEVENLASSLQELKETGDLSDDAITALENNFNTAADLILESNPGMLELSKRAVESQAELGRELKDAAARGEFQTISELAPKLVKLYRESDPGSQNLADIASTRAEQLSTQSPSAAQESFERLATSLSDRVDPTTQAQVGVGEAEANLKGAGTYLGGLKRNLSGLGTTVRDRVPGGDLGTAAREGIQALMGYGLGQTADQQTVARRIFNLLEGPQAGAAEQRLLNAAGQGPSAAEQQLLQAAGSPSSAEAQALGQFGQQALQGGQRAASGVEQELQKQAMQQLGFQAAGASPEEQALQQRISGLIDSAGTLSPDQQRQVEQEAIALGERQGRVRDTSTAAGVAGRLSEARRADETQDLMAAQQLLGQQQAMQQGRTAEELQRMGMGSQFAGQSEALAQQRLAEERALQQMGVGAAGTAAGLQAQQAGLQQQALQAAGGMAGQRAGQAQQALGAAGSLEQSRLSQQLQGTGLAQNIAQAGFASDMAGREQQLQELGLGSQEAARFAQQQSQQDAMQGQIIGQQAGLAGQLAAFAGAEAGLAGQQFAQQTALEQQQFQQQAQRDSTLASLYGAQAGLEQQQFAQQQALAGQADARLGQAYQMQRAMGPDVGAFFGRPASQAEGLQVLGMGQQQAQYGTTPQATDPMLGVNMALQQQANQAGLDAAAMSASAQAQGGLMSGLGSIGGAMLGGPVGGFGSALGGALFGGKPPCWVAREVYGQNNPMWLLFRGWLFDEAPSWFRKIYIKYGERFAEFISNKPFIKSFIRKWMTSIVKKHYK